MIAELGVLKISLFSILIIQRSLRWKGCIASQASQERPYAVLKGKEIPV